MRRLLTTLLALALTLAVAAPALAGTPYVVQPGDTLTRIAARLNVTVAELIALNQLADPNKLQVGQVLLVPGGEAPAPSGGTGGTYVVQRGDSLARIAARHNTTIDALIALNTLSTTALQIGQVLTLPGAAPAAPPSVYQRVRGTASFVRRIHAALDWLQAEDTEALQLVEQYITDISVSLSGNLASARPVASGCAVRALARWDMSVPMMAAMLYHEAVHCRQFATQGELSVRQAEIQAYEAQLVFMERHAFPASALDYYRQVLEYYRAQSDDSRYIPPPPF